MGLGLILAAAMFIPRTSVRNIILPLKIDPFINSTRSDQQFQGVGLKISSILTDKLNTSPFVMPSDKRACDGLVDILDIFKRDAGVIPSD
jgi:hypothetical protein